MQTLADRDIDMAPVTDLDHVKETAYYRLEGSKKIALHHFLGRN